MCRRLSSIVSTTVIRSVNCRLLCQPTTVTSIVSAIEQLSSNVLTTVVQCVDNGSTTVVSCVNCRPLRCVRCVNCSLSVVVLCVECRPLCRPTGLLCRLSSVDVSNVVSCVDQLWSVMSTVARCVDCCPLCRLSAVVLTVIGCVDIIRCVKSRLLCHCHQICQSCTVVCGGNSLKFRTFLF